MIDLHTHTVYSDGTDSVVDLLKKAADKGLEVITITDHDTVNAYDELARLDISKYFSGIIIPGAELKTTFNKIPIEILAYNIDIEKMKESPCTNLVDKKTIQERYLQNFIEVGNTLGIECSPDLKMEVSEGYASNTYYKDIKKYPKNYDIIPELLNDKQEKFYRLTSSNPMSPFYIDESSDNLDINFVIDEIHRCGGLAFLAHLYVYRIDSHIEFLESIINETKLDGIECYYSTFKEEETKTILEVTKKHKLYVSGGSDYHGMNKKDLDLGNGYGKLNISYEVIKDWFERK